MSTTRTLVKVLGRVAPAALLATALGACVVRGDARARVWVPAPTAVVIVEQPPPPPPPRIVVVTRPGFIWIEGRYAWTGNRYVWNDGYYERERVGHVYRPGRWKRQGRGHVWVDGRWYAHGHVKKGRSNDRGRGRVRDHR
jgi:hypothetical protein